MATDLSIYHWGDHSEISKSYKCYELFFRARVPLYMQIDVTQIHLNFENALVYIYSSQSWTRLWTGCGHGLFIVSEIAP
jgi:hypothetical protein